MRITVVHNPTAGAEHVSRHGLCAALRAAGHQPVYASTSDDDWAAAVQEADDLVLVAGGDGTIAGVAAHLVHRPVPLAVLPFGTANNVARALGITGHWQGLVRSLSEWRPAAFDIGLASGPWGELPCLEGAGFGLFAEAMVQREPDAADVGRAYGRDMELMRDLVRLRERLSQAVPRRCTIEMDDRTVTADALVVGIMNIPSVGPRLDLSREALVDDGLLHVVIGRDTDRAVIGAYLQARLEGEPAALQLEEHAAREVHVAWEGPVLHVDDRPLELGAESTTLRATVAAGALCVLVPPPASPAAGTGRAG
jgi:diacylglycerol kinase (ATP)